MVDYDVIVTIVVIELVFAFSIGIICILFSINLILAIKDNPEGANLTIAAGDFPPSVPVIRGSFSTRRISNEPDTVHTPLTIDSPERQRIMSHESEEMDIETPLDPNAPRPGEGFFGVLQSFTSYLRIW
jgi:hypothetical protein